MSTNSAPDEGSPWPKKTDRTRSRALKREAVMTMAVRFFNEKGFHATSLDDVAKALNVTKPTIYHYFRNKDEILFECVVQGLHSIADAAGRVEAQGGTGLERLKSLAYMYAICMTQDFCICISRTADHELSPASRARFRALKREIDQTMRQVIRDGIADGTIAPESERMISFTLAGALNWIARWFDPEGPMSREEVAQSVVSILMNGVAAEAGRGTPVRAPESS
ncbi:TetR/AcrR family transcriptional regulator [Palleronia abyssalis]|uniref:HTH-type transcriptional repressor KstR2 n=1 Tax=Palleronia abyssalis TaxID=1501240 RepID=A0A2R8BVH2_9RHOB|nr:TetR/AcrR family transcriptional regulator [Palleronia abyssalis]SPJ24115.1 HTH-type transcriptional repressor KstR2 [Palleronia abyssalis]